MTAGLPGAGIGGMFYMLNALRMPLSAAWRSLRGKNKRDQWGPAIRQFTIAAGILVALWLTGWALGHLIAAHPETLGRMKAPAHREVPNVLKTGALILSFGTLCFVLVAVQVARLLIKPRASAARRGALIGLIAFALVPAAKAQTTSVAAHLSAAESAFESGDTHRAMEEYLHVLGEDPRNSRALFRMGQLTRSDPQRSLSFFRRYVAYVPDDAWGHMALGDELARDGQVTAALAEYDVAERLVPGNEEVSQGRAKIVAKSRQNAPSVDVATSGAGDSDGNRSYRGALTAGIPIGDRTRFSVTGGGKRLTGFTDATEYEGSAQIFARPTSQFRIEASAGAVRSSADSIPLVSIQTADLLFTQIPGRGRGLGRGSGSNAPPEGTVINNATATNHTTAIGSIRATWKQPGPAGMLDVRANRILLDATPVLVFNRVVRNEVAARADVPLLPRIRLRGAAKADTYNAADDDNTRTSILGGLAMQATNAIEFSGVFQRLAFDHATTSGYFAPRLAHLAELGSYAEFEADNGTLLVIDGGVGAQRFADFGTGLTNWKPAYRLFAQLNVPVRPGSEFRAELDSYDSVLGSEAASSESWRYLSASISVRIALR